MEAPLVSQGSGSVDGVTPLRARTLEAYYALRQFRPPHLIGTPEILGWLLAHKQGLSRPSGSLVKTVPLAAKVPHRHDGRPRRDTVLRFDPATPLFALSTRVPRRPATEVGTLLAPALLGATLPKLARSIAALAIGCLLRRATRI